MTTLESIFDAARRLAGAERAIYLDRACAGDAALRERVEALLHADSAGDEFLRADEADLTAAVGTVGAGGAIGAIGTTPVPPSESAGESIDRYRLLKQLGEGGFGTVWMAEQREPVRRTVAIKIIKVGMDTRQVIARFEIERQALALMDHPNIAKVLDAGATATGRPYFVMELVRGVPILAYCDGERLDTRQRLTLFVQVCHAIQHAHQKGIIHRDIKPSNVLVALHDGVPTVKVIDFGIAKATSAELTQKTLFTEHHQVIGTPAYMSPEQAEMTGLDIDTRSDVYSLGVLLYELLTGTTPFDRRELLGKGYAEMMRIIREVEPHRPSSRLSALGETGVRTAELRRADVRRLRSLLRGDLDWIVMKCLEKDRARRYETANGLADDIRRHLAGEPVRAAPPGAGYLIRKFVRRNRNGVIVAGVLAAIVLLGTAGTTAGLVRAINEGARADAAAANEYAARIVAEANEARAIVEAERAERRAYSALLVAADGAIRAGETAAARRFLADAPERLRGWEWAFLNHQVDRSVRRIQTQDPRGHVVAESPDGRTIVTIGSEATLRFFDARTGAHLRDIDSDLEYAVFALSNDGSLLVLQEVGLGSRFRIVDWRSGRVLWEAHGRTGYLPFSADDRTLVATAPGRGEIVVHESRSGRELGRYVVPAASPQHASFGGDGNRVLYIDESAESVGVLDLASKSVELWTPPTWGLSRTVDPRHGRLVVYDNAAEQLVVHDIASRTVWRRIDVEPLMVQQTQFSVDGRRLAARGRDRSSNVLHVVDLEAGRLVARLHGHDAFIFREAFSRDGARILSIDHGGIVCVWDVPEQDNPHLVPFLESSIRLGAAFFPTGSSAGAPPDRRIACGGWGSVQLWDSRSGTLHWDAQLGARYVERLAVSPDRSMIAAVETFGDLVILAVADGTVIHRHEGFDAGNTALEWTPDGTAILLGGGCGRVAWVEPESGRRDTILRVHETPITASALSRDGRRLVVATGAGLVAMDNSVQIPAPGVAGSVAIVDVVDRAVVDRRDDFPHGLTAATFSHDGGMLALGDSDGGVFIFGDGFDEPIARSSVGRRVRSMAFNRAGDRLAVGGLAAFTTVIEVSDGTPLLNLELEYAAAVSFTSHAEGHETLVSVHPWWFAEYATSAPDPALVRARSEERRVREIADDLYRRLVVSPAVLAHLEDRADLDEVPDDLRDAVIRHVRGRGDHMAKLLSDALVASRTQRQSTDYYRRALRRLEFLERRQPERGFLLAILRGLVHHRLEEHDAARTHLGRAEALVPLSPEWAVVPLAAAILIAHADGDVDRVREIWTLLNGRVEAEGIPRDETSRTLFGEVGILMQAMPLE